MKKVNKQTPDVSKFLFPQHQMAKIFGISVQAFVKWPVEAKEKRGREKLYDLREAVQFAEKRAEAKRKGPYNNTVEKARLIHHQANIASIQEQEIIDGLIAPEEVIAICVGSRDVVKARILDIGRKIKKSHPDLSEEILDEIDSLAIEAFEEIGRDGIPEKLRPALEKYFSNRDCQASLAI